MPERYFVKDGYRHRPDPEYARDTDDDGMVWQPDVYPEAARLARLLGATCIVDLGCGGGGKLAELHPRFELVGIDLPGPNLEHCRRRYPFADWLDHDLEGLVALPVPEPRLKASLLVCSDVIEHLRRPDRLLVKLRSALDLARAVVLSTPERDLTWGPDHAGPPPNPCHVREWSRAELAAFLDDAGLVHRSMVLTRSNDGRHERKTMLWRLFPDTDARRAAAVLEDGDEGDGRHERDVPDGAGGA